jgi:tetratricopeptide (TPR) repeat protein
LREIDGLEGMGQVDRALALVEERLADEWVREEEQYAWRVRYKVRQVRCALIEGKRRQARKTVTRVVDEAVSLFSYAPSEVALQCRMEGYLLEGDYESRWRDLVEAEEAWDEAAQLIPPLMQGGSEYGADWCWVEQIAERFFRQRFAHGLWDENIMLGMHWNELRLQLGLDTDGLAELAWCTIWARGDEGELADRIIEEVTRDVLEGGGLLGRVATLQGVKLARKGRRAKALRKLEKAIRVHEVQEQRTGLWYTYTRQALAALRARKALPTPQPERPPYEVMPGSFWMMDKPFDVWLFELVESFSGRKRRGRGR